ncbi:MAG: VWA domain-containing protein [Myxococcales bacterium]|nr:VWA domain-containing protein [Myxococcales bacterium]
MLWAGSFGLSAALALGCNIEGDPNSARGRSTTEASGSTAADGGSVPLNAAAASAFGNSDAPFMQLPELDAALSDAESSLASNPPDQSGCGAVELAPMVNTEVEHGNLLVVFDNSGSMSSLWGDLPRWQAAGNALRDAVSSLSEYVNVGAIIFPTDTNCAVEGLDSPLQIRFVKGSAFISAWDRFMGTNVPNGGTPLGGGLIVADAALQESTLPGQTSVVVITDGAPNCDVAPLSTLPPQWLAQGVRTHVVGLPGSESAITVLDDLASAGGTGQHLTPDDPRSLRRQLANIVSETVVSALSSCVIALDPPPPNLDDVHVVVTEAGVRTDAARDLGSGGGWTIAADGTEIELFGAFCDRGLAGEYDRISIEFGCVELPPLPPPPPLE